MIHYPRWKIILVCIVCAFGILFASPNLMTRDTLDGLPSWLPSDQVNLGLDLQGGSHLLLQVETDAVIDERLEAVLDSIRIELRGARIGYTSLEKEDASVRFRVSDIADADEARAAITDVDPDIEINVNDDEFVVTLSESAIAEARQGAVEQSIEVVRRRIDETGTREPNIQREGAERIIVQLPGLDDPSRIRDLLGETAQLSFRFIDESVTAEEAERGNVPAGSQLLPADADADDPDRQYVVRNRVMVSGERLVDAQPTYQDGMPVVSFRFDSLGARQFGEATRDNVGRLFAIVLDEKVISAPVIREPILGGSGVISGDFTTEAARDLAILLRAGALPAPLTILQESTVGPGLGADSVRAGQMASAIGLVAVLVVMAFAYGRFGIYANIALLTNMVLILAVLSTLQATLTLPGIAGIVLTIGMAVDANVLVFERIREEIANGRSPISAIDAGYQKALSTIIDANVTTFIAAAILFQFGSGPVRGFAVTLGIGILTSMFTALMVTRLFVVLWLRRRRPKTVPI